MHLFLILKSTTKDFEQEIFKIDTIINTKELEIVLGTDRICSYSNRNLSGASNNIMTNKDQQTVAKRLVSLSICFCYGNPALEYTSLYPLL